jgi:hypothetical protein
MHFDHQLSFSCACFKNGHTNPPNASEAGYLNVVQYLVQKLNERGFICLKGLMLAIFGVTVVLAIGIRFLLWLLGDDDDNDDEHIGLMAIQVIN